MDSYNERNLIKLVERFVVAFEKLVDLIEEVEKDESRTD